MQGSRQERDRRQQGPGALSRRDLARAAAALAGTGAVLSAASAYGSGTAAADVAQGDAARAEPSDLGPVPHAVSAFSARLLQLAVDPTENSVCSPLSAAIALSMTRLGAAGTTADGMDDALGIADEDAWHAGMNTLTQTLETRSGVRDENGEFVPVEPGEFPSGDADAVLLDLANSVWLQHDLTPEQAFLDALSRSYGAPIHLADFVAAPAAAVDAVNAWTAEATRDKITEIVSTDSVTDETRLILVNAVYLRAAWEQPFDADLTAPEPFHPADGSETQVDMMHGTTRDWYEDDLCRATRRTYLGGDSRLAMALVQPTGTIADVLAHWANSGLADLLGGFDEAMVDLAVPTWDIEWDASLVDPLSELGMAAAFAPRQADLTGFTEEDPELFLSDVLQKAAITVDEEGTEAAAATAVIANTSSAPAEPPEQRELILDRPFLYVVHDVETQVPLFLGIVADPSQRAGA